MLHDCLGVIEKAELERRWLDQNRKAIASIKFFIDQHGLLASKLRYRPLIHGGADAPRT